jgi:hypothetical protein
MDSAPHSHDLTEVLHRFDSVGDISIQRFAGVFLLDEVLHHLTVMYDGRRHLLRNQQLGLRVGLDLVLVFVVLIIFVLGPQCIGFLLSALFLIPVLGNFALLNLLDILLGVPLNRHLEERGINHLTFVHVDSVTVQLTAQQLQPLDAFGELRN